MGKFMLDEFFLTSLYLFKFQDSLIMKNPKKNPLALRMVVFMFVMVCGVYICSVCLRQYSAHSSEHLLKVQVGERPCEAPNVEPSEKTYVHFPKPKTFSRLDIVHISFLMVSCKSLLNLLSCIWW